MPTPNLPQQAHTQATSLINIAYDFVPQQYHKKIEFSFQIFDSQQSTKKKGWRMGFSTFTMDEKNNLVKVPESKPNPKKGKRNITSHTHLTRNEEKEKNRPGTQGKTYLKYGCVYIHWKLLIVGDKPRHVWDANRLTPLGGYQGNAITPPGCSSTPLPKVVFDLPKVVFDLPKVEFAGGGSGAEPLITRAIMQPIYVGESGAPGKSDFFERSTRARTSNYVPHKLNWIDEVQGGYVIWIINGLTTEWRLKLETHLIEICGRSDLEKGPLVNRTNGGKENRGRLQGHAHSQETRQKQRDAANTRESKMDEKTKANRSAKISATRTGVKFTEEHKAALSQASRGIPKNRIRCEHCNKDFAPTPFARYHGDNCATRPGFSDTRDEQGKLLTWEKVNKKKHQAINQPNENKRTNSRQVVADWVLKECAGKTLQQKVGAYQFWKPVKDRPRRSNRWYSVAFKRAGKWYSVDEKKARSAWKATKKPPLKPV